MKVLAIGAHPDDIEIYCSGTIAKHVARGDKCYFLILTDGSKGGKKEVRKKEALKSAQLLGVKRVFFSDFVDTTLRYEPKLCPAIGKIIKKVKPDRIYTHNLSDYHQDHKATAETSAIAGKDVNEILMYEGSVMSDFFPNYFVDITDFIELKKKIIYVFKSQNIRNFRNLDYIYTFARFNGLQANFKLKYAESFRVFKMIKTKNV